MVPTTVWPCQGIANITRPSLVWGTMMAAPAGRKEPSNTRWIPWLGAIRGRASGWARRRTASQKGPAALITTFAPARSSRPLSRSWATTPSTKPSASRVRAVTGA